VGGGVAASSWLAGWRGRRTWVGRPALHLAARQALLVGDEVCVCAQGGLVLEALHDVAAPALALHQLVAATLPH
jgi:hypothetical protein